MSLEPEVDSVHPEGETRQRSGTVAMINLLRATTNSSQDGVVGLEDDQKHLHEAEEKSKELLHKHQEIAKKMHAQRSLVEKLITGARTANLEELKKLASDLEKEETTYDQLLTEDHGARVELNKVLRNWRSLVLKNQIHMLKSRRASLIQKGTEESESMFAKLQRIASADLEAEVKANSHQSKDLKWNISSKHITLNEKDCLGSGGFGTVYKGKLLGKEVAIKQLLVQTWTAETHDEFEREVKIMLNLRHPNLLLFMGACMEPGKICIVTEFMSRGSLHDLIHPKEGQCELTFRQKLQFAKETAQGLNFMHKMEPALLHLDLKPQNVLIDENWNAKVADFGLSQLRSEEDNDRGRVGTPLYMAPEMLLEKKVTHKTDVYSFSILLWEMYTEQIPFENLGIESMDDMTDAIAMEGQRPPIPKDMPKSLSTLLEKCWETNLKPRPCFKDMLQDNVFENIVHETLFGNANTGLGRELWETNFFGKWRVKWNEFVPVFVKTIGLKQEEVPDLDLHFYVLKNALQADDHGEIITIENFVALFKWLGPLTKDKSILDRVKNLYEKPYFFGFLDSLEAKSYLLSSNQPGTFLLRFSNSEPGCFTMSHLNKSNKVVHWRIAYSYPGGFTFSDQTYKTIEELVESKSKTLLKPCGSNPFQHLFRVGLSPLTRHRSLGESLWVDNENKGADDEDEDEEPAQNKLNEAAPHASPIRSSFLVSDLSSDQLVIPPNLNAQNHKEEKLTEDSGRSAVPPRLKPELTKQESTLKKLKHKVSNKVHSVTDKIHDKIHPHEQGHKEIRIAKKEAKAAAKEAQKMTEGGDEIRDEKKRRLSVRFFERDDTATKKTTPTKKDRASIMIPSTTSPLKKASESNPINNSVPEEKQTSKQAIPVPTQPQTSKQAIPAQPTPAPSESNLDAPKPSLLKTSSTSSMNGTNVEKRDTKKNLNV